MATMNLQKMFVYNNLHFKLMSSGISKKNNAAELRIPLFANG
jgi:hypothetical protein